MDPQPDNEDTQEQLDPPKASTSSAAKNGITFNDSKVPWISETPAAGTEEPPTGNKGVNSSSNIGT